MWVYFLRTKNRTSHMGCANFPFSLFRNFFPYETVTHSPLLIFFDALKKTPRLWNTKQAFGYLLWLTKEPAPLYFIGSLSPSMKPPLPRTEITWDFTTEFSISLLERTIPKNEINMFMKITNSKRGKSHTFVLGDETTTMEVTVGFERIA